MISILDIMFVKRFCLPSNIELDNSKLSLNQPSADINMSMYKDVMLPCVCDRYNHIACVLHGKCKFEKG